MPYGRRFRGGELILPTIGFTTVGAVGASYLLRKKTRRKSRKHKSKSKHIRRHSPKRVRRSGRKIYYAKKTGQPYIKLANGRAKFIKGRRRK